MNKHENLTDTQLLLKVHESYLKLKHSKRKGFHKHHGNIEDMNREQLLKALDAIEWNILRTVLSGDHDDY